MPIYFSSSVKHLEEKFPDKNNIGKLEISTFSNDEKYVRAFGYDNKEKNLVVSSPKTDSDLIETLFILDAVKRSYKKDTGLLISYYMYGKQDKMFEEWEAVSARVVATMFSSMTYESKIYTIDPHIYREPGEFEYYEVKMENISAVPLLAEHIKKNFDNPFLVSPDLTAGEVVDRISKLLKNCETGVYEKERGEKISQGEKIDAEIEKMESKFDKEKMRGNDVVICDDVILTGGTIVKAIKSIREVGPKSINIYSVHGFFSGSAIEKINAAGFDSMITTDSLDSPYGEVSIVPLIQELYERINNSKNTEQGERKRHLDLY